MPKIIVWPQDRLRGLIVVVARSLRRRRLRRALTCVGAPVSETDRGSQLNVVGVVRVMVRAVVVSVMMQVNVVCVDCADDGVKDGYIRRASGRSKLEFCEFILAKLEKDVSQLPLHSHTSAQVDQLVARNRWRKETAW